MDGVLVDTEPLHIESFREFLDGLKIPYTDDFLFGLIGFSVPDNVRQIYRRFLNLSDENLIEEGIRKRDAIYLRLLKETPLKPNPGIAELVEFCLDRNIRLALASSSTREQVDHIFQNLEQSSKGNFRPAQIFEIVLSGDDVRHRKPHPEIYLKTVELLKEIPDNCLAIEDSPAGVKSAQAAGLICLALKSRFIPREKLAGADALLNTLYDARDLLSESLTD